MPWFVPLGLCLPQVGSHCIRGISFRVKNLDLLVKLWSTLKYRKEEPFVALFGTVRADLTTQSCASGRRGRTRSYCGVLKGLCNRMRRYAAPLVHFQRLLHATIFKHVVFATRTRLPVQCKSGLLKPFCRTVSVCTKNCAQFINTDSSQLGRYAVAAAKYITPIRDTVGSPENSRTFAKSTWNYVPQHLNLYQRHCENIKSTSCG
jgi:hypothetical protein